MPNSALEELRLLPDDHINNRRALDKVIDPRREIGSVDRTNAVLGGGKAIYRVGW